MPVQNRYFKKSARPDLATYLLQILIPATFNSLVCQKGQFTLQLRPRRCFVRKIFGYYKCSDDYSYGRAFGRHAMLDPRSTMPRNGRPKTSIMN